MQEEFSLAGAVYHARKRLRHFALLLVLAFFVFWYVSEFVIERIKVDLLPEKVSLIVTSPMEYVMVRLQIALALGAIAAMPFFALLILRRFRLSVRKTSLAIWGILALLMFALGFAFTYFILLPTAVNVLTRLTQEAGVVPFYSVNQFVLFAFVTSLIFSLMFELPLIISWLAINGHVSVATLKEKRKHVYVATFIVAAIITADPTPVSQVLLAIPLIALYEVSIISARIFGRGA